VSDDILVLNAGSSSIKFQLFAPQADETLAVRLKGKMDGIGVMPRLLAKSASGQTLIDKSWPASEIGGVPAALDKVFELLRSQIAGDFPAAIGHRVVHGGPGFDAPQLVDDAVLETLETYVPLAPLHQPNNLAPIRAIRLRLRHLPQVACFDTAFHRSHPDVADRYAIPEALHAQGIRRYGFHGLSYEYIARQLPSIDPVLAERRAVVAHLGSGASMCALLGGRSVESTMGFTALDGLPMGTRCGQLDPGIVLHLLREKRMSGEAIEQLLYHDCGLKGLSGISNDVRELLTSDDPRAEAALDFFAYKIAQSAAMLAASMGGIDGLVFTAGIGENAPAIREAVARRLEWLGLSLDREANAANASRISAAGSRISCYVIPTDEEWMIAHHTRRLLATNLAERH
jgi:acetate kinase